MPYFSTATDGGLVLAHAPREDDRNDEEASPDAASVRRPCDLGPVPHSPGYPTPDELRTAAGDDPELLRLAEQQIADDARHEVFKEVVGSVSLDAPCRTEDGDGTMADVIGAVDDFDGAIYDWTEWTGLKYDVRPEPPEIVCFLRSGRGQILAEGATWHGTNGGYTNHKCRCARCRAAHAEQARRDRAQRAEED